MSDSAPLRKRKATGPLGFDALVTGASLAVGVVFAMLWWQERQHLKGMQEQMTPIREEAERYRSGLREEVMRSHKLSEDLKAAQTRISSTH